MINIIFKPINPWEHTFGFNTYIFSFFRVAPSAWVRSQAKSQTRAVAAGLHHSHSSARSFTHWARPGIKPASSRILVRFVTSRATTGSLGFNTCPFPVRLPWKSCPHFDKEIQIAHKCFYKIARPSSTSPDISAFLKPDLLKKISQKNP